MAVERNEAPSRLQLQFQTGVDNEGKPIIRTKTYANVKPATSDEDLYQVGEALAQLQQHMLMDILRHDSASLIAV